MTDLLSMLTDGPLLMTRTTGALVVVVLLMVLRVVRALQRAPVSSRQTLGSRTRPLGV